MRGSDWREGQNISNDNKLMREILVSFSFLIIRRAITAKRRGGALGKWRGILGGEGGGVTRCQKSG